MCWRMSAQAAEGHAKHAVHAFGDLGERSRVEPNEQAGRLGQRRGGEADGVSCSGLRAAIETTVEDRFTLLAIGHNIDLSNNGVLT